MISDLLVDVEQKMAQGYGRVLEESVINFVAQGSPEELSTRLNNPEFRENSAILRYPAYGAHKQDVGVWFSPIINHITENLDPRTYGVTAANADALTSVIEVVAQWMYLRQHQRTFGRFPGIEATAFIGAYSTYELLQQYVQEHDSQAPHDEAFFRFQAFQAPFTEQNHPAGGKDQRRRRKNAYQLALAFVDYLQILSPKEAARWTRQIYRQRNTQMLAAVRKALAGESAGRERAIPCAETLEFSVR